MKYCYIVDIDGTLSDPTHRLHHLDKGDWDGFFGNMGDDTVKDHVACIVRCMHSIGMRDEGNNLVDLFLVSGRPDNYRDITVGWLNTHYIRFDNLFMRPAGDTRPDYVIKKEILDMIQNQMGYKVVGVIDDRPSVLKMWRENGIPVLAVDYHSANEKNQCENDDKR